MHHEAAASTLVAFLSVYIGSSRVMDRFRVRVGALQDGQCSDERVSARCAVCADCAMCVTRVAEPLIVNAFMRSAVSLREPFMTAHTVCDH